MLFSFCAEEVFASVLLVTVSAFLEKWVEGRVQANLQVDSARRFGAHCWLVCATQLCSAVWNHASKPTPQLAHLLRMQSGTQAEQLDGPLFASYITTEVDRQRFRYLTSSLTAFRLVPMASITVAHQQLST